MSEQKPNSLIDAIRSRNVQEVKRLIILTHDPDSPDETGQTALMVAVKLNESKIVSLLLENGATVDAMIKEGLSAGDTAVRRACSPQGTEILRILLKFGANPGLYDKASFRAGAPPIHLSAINDVVESIDLLLDYGADIDARDLQLQRTALLAALDTDVSENAALRLISRGASVNVYDKHGDSPLSEAIRYNLQNIEKALRERGAVT
jgi:ankyrin repeat protein